MPRDDFYTPTDIDVLRMENELLAFEVRFLKARLAESERSVAPLRESKARLEDQLEQARARLEDQSEESERLRVQLEERLAEADSSIARLARVEADLVLLLRSMANGPLARVFRLRQSFRDLEQRYLGDGA